jgi:hypothetical protein
MRRWPIGPEAEWACCCGGEIKEKEWVTSRTGLKVEKE